MAFAGIHAGENGRTLTGKKQWVEIVAAYVLAGVAVFALGVTLLTPLGNSRKWLDESDEPEG